MTLQNLFGNLALDATVSTGNTTLGSILSKLSSDPATGTKQGTLVAQDATFTQVTGTGTLAALNATVAITAGRRATLTMQVTGTWVATISLQASLDGGTTWVTINGGATWWNAANGGYSGAITGNGIYQASVTGFTSLRVAATGYTSGTANIYLVASDALSGVAIDTPLPAGTNSIGTVTLAAGAASVGTVGLAAGSNTVGTVLLGAGSAAVGTVTLGTGSNTVGTVTLGAGTNAVGGVTAVTTSASGSITAASQAVDGTTDLAQYGQVSVQVSGTYVATLQLQVSNDGTNWAIKSLIAAGFSQGSSPVNSITGTGVWYGHIGARYFRVYSTAWTSGTAVVTIRYNAVPGTMPISQVGLRVGAGSDGNTASSIDFLSVGAYNGTSVDRLYNAAGAGSSASARSLSVAVGIQPLASINAATAIAAGTALDNTTARPTHTLQVDVTTTTAGTASAHTVTLQGSLDNSNWTTIGTVTAASTSTVATDTSNHANTSVNGYAYRYVRANWTAIPTSWVGSLTARVVSA